MFFNDDSWLKWVKSGEHGFSINQVPIYDDYLLNVNKKNCAIYGDLIDKISENEETQEMLQELQSFFETLLVPRLEVLLNRKLTWD